MAAINAEMANRETTVNSRLASLAILMEARGASCLYAIGEVYSVLRTGKVHTKQELMQDHQFYPRKTSRALSTYSND